MLTVRYFAGAKAAAGLAEEKAEAETLGGLKAVLAERHGPGLEKVLSVSSFLVEGASTRDDDAGLEEGATVEVLPPFAGG
ncbi:MoaD/ThiS family protein [Salininema proteolyticum]|uniref:MoaD/ThiS family protein n=1 Tax=Salininema proteolyticum TaxID=1607685 RepID=A0ABV8U548_9ACTN